MEDRDLPRAELKLYVREHDLSGGFLNRSCDLIAEALILMENGGSREFTLRTEKYGGWHSVPGPNDRHEIQQLMTEFGMAIAANRGMLALDVGNSTLRSIAVEQERLGNHGSLLQMMRQPLLLPREARAR